MKLKESIEKEITTNRSVFNKCYKKYLEKTGKIRCSFCKYHKSENHTDNHYGGWEDNLKFPSWKLCTKNKKQWEKKKLKFSTSNKWYYKKKFYTTIKW